MRQNAYRLYDALVADARHPAFYRRCGLADQFDSRFDMLVLHLVLALRHVRQEKGGARLGKQLLGVFFDDMDQLVRESGVGDLGVGRRVRRMAEAFYGRQRAYDSALNEGDEKALAAALARNFCLSAGASGAQLLAAYMQARSQALAGAPAGLDWAQKFALTRQSICIMLDGEGKQKRGPHT